MEKLIAMAGLFAALAALPARADNEGHVLDKLWKQYETLSASDLPKDQQAVLLQIKQQASQRRLSWDFYDAVVHYERLGTRINWKDREALHAAASADIAAYDEPVVTYFYSTYDGPAIPNGFLKASEERLKSSSNPEFHKRDWAASGRIYSPALLENFSSDYDYVVWSLFARRLDSPVEEAFRGRYPLEQLVEFEKIDRLPGNTAAFEEFAAKYSGKAVSLLARQQLLQEKFNRLHEKKASSDEFKALREECAAFERDRKASPEKTLAGCCKAIESLIETLDDKDIDFEIKDDMLTVRLRNLPNVDVEVKSGSKTVHRVTLTNPVRSYYATDTIRYAIPAIDDGEYDVICSNGKVKADSRWNKYSISLVTKYDASGYWAFAADYISGEPVKGYEKGFRKVEPASDGSFRVSIQENGRTRLSEQVKLYDYGLGPHPRDSRMEALILTDRSAFNPEDTVRFKVVLYHKDYNLAAAGAGTEMEVVLTDARRTEISRLKLTAGEFGSAAGSFALPRGERNGSYNIRVKVAGQILASRSITVDDFVLPSFALTFDRRDEPVYAGDPVVFSGAVKAYSGHSLSGADISYTIRKWGDIVAEGNLNPDPTGHFEVTVQSDSTGYQHFDIQVKVVDGTGETAMAGQTVSVRQRPVPDEKPRQYYFEDIGEEGRIGIRTVAGTRTVWALVDLYGTDGKLIESRLERIDPDGAVARKDFAYDYLKEYPEVVTLSVFYFQNATRYSYSVEARRKDTRYDLPLSFTRFLDTTAPGASYEFLISTAAGVECAAAIFDKSSETIRPNVWTQVRPLQYPGFAPYYNSVSGTNSAYGGVIMFRAAGGRMLTKNATMSMARMDAMDDAVPMVEESVAQESYAAAAEAVEVEEATVTIREDFSTTVAWEPFLRSDEEGRISFRFTNSDKLSTFWVQLFAHDRAMRNTTLRREMLVTLPVKIAVLEPQYLYAGDSWNVRVTLSSSVDREVKGVLKVNGRSVEASVPAYSQAAFEVPVPFDPASSELVLTAVFTPGSAEDGADGVRVKVPVLEAWQTITEAHSGVLLSGADRAALISDLRSRFVNFPASEASLREISILDMVREAIPGHFDFESENVISLTRALYAALLARTIGSEGPDDAVLAGVAERILKCRGGDGGFGWIAGFDSSPIVTAVVLDLCGGLRSRGLNLPAELSAALPAAVEFLDGVYFNTDAAKRWIGGLSMEQYLYVRSLYPAVKFTAKTTAKWRKAARNYLVPASDRGLQGAIFAKARRMKTLQALLSTDEGVALSRRFGISLFAAGRLRRSLESDTHSLVQYAVNHRDAGTYFPNAVMPWRGLLESELYAHSLICDLLESRGEHQVAEGIRLWLMLQKETQQWGADPATVNALASVLDGSPETLDTRVIALSGSVRKPFDEILATGNGFTIERQYYLLDQKGGRKPVAPGDTLHVGDRVMGVYSIWSAENRSFVHVSIPRPACLRPEDQLSSRYGWNAYRSVRFDRSEYWFESYPEEKTDIRESFFVTQSGVFHAGIPEIESLYAPHYRANGVSGGEMTTKSR
ncbi:MAG: hypothetical protein IJU27_04015 [Bacteroidales bacterium]|nr:hypothetical protein [Bacteroidales bacterium]